MKQMWVRATALLVASTLVLASCGDDDESPSSSPPTSDPGTTLPVAPDPEDPDDAPADPGDIALTEPAGDLAAALNCPEERQHAEVPGVLLIPGTGLGSEESWSLTMGRALPDEGYDTCTVELVDSATGDIQRSAEYVVAAIRTMQDEGYDEIAIVGFSQGALAARWALAWWPDVREPVVDLISIAGPHGGSAATAPLCVEECAAALHQMTAGSMFLDALDDRWADVSDLAVTVITSETDTVVTVDEASVLDGASVIVVQDVCPGRGADHVELLADPAVFAIVLDALENDGPASVDRFDDAACDGEPIATADWDPAALTEAAFGVIVTAAPVAEEPELAPYARR